MKNILITGASGGLGRAACEQFLKQGYAVWGMDLIEKDPIDGLHFLSADLTDADSVSRAFGQLSAETDHLDIILHTAGIYDLNSLIEISESAMKKIFDVNLMGVYRVNKAFLPLLHSGSRILITTSELAPLDPLPFTGIYAVTKAALEKYAYSLRMELQLLEIQVTLIRPGAIRTSLLKTSTDALDLFCENTKLYTCNAQRFKRIVGNVEAKNIPPERVAKLILRATEAKRPRYVYSINRNPLLLLLNALPKRMQNWIIKLILKP